MGCLSGQHRGVARHLSPVKATNISSARRGNNSLRPRMHRHCPWRPRRRLGNGPRDSPDNRSRSLTEAYLMYWAIGFSKWGIVVKEGATWIALGAATSIAQSISWWMAGAPALMSALALVSRVMLVMSLVALGMLPGMRSICLLSLLYMSFLRWLIEDLSVSCSRTDGVCFQLFEFADLSFN
jgi:hypothetical protein